MTTSTTTKSSGDGVQAGSGFLDAVQIGGHSLRYYVTGWRFGVIALIILAIFPVFGNQTLLFDGMVIGVWVMLAQGLNIVVGYAGLLDLGYVAFFVTGAYTEAVFTQGLLQGADGISLLHVPTISFWLLIPLGALLAGLFGVLLGAPTLRLRGDYLAIVTLGFGEIVPIVYQNVPWFFGQLGMTPLPPPDIHTPATTVTFSNRLQNEWFYWVVLAAVAIIIIAISALRDSSLGRAWVAIREDETAAAASGVNLVRTKLLAFGLGATTGGIGGVFYAGFTPSVAPPDFNFGISITVLVMVVLGGIGSIPGVFLGAALIEFFKIYVLPQIDPLFHSSSLVAPNSAPLHFAANLDFNVASNLILGIVLVLMILLRPQGLIPDRRRSLELHGEGTAPENESAVGLLAQEEAGMSETEPGTESGTVYSGAGSDAEPREGKGESA